MSIKNLFLLSENKKAFFFYALKEKGVFALKQSESSDGYIFKTSRVKTEIKNKSKKREAIDKCQNFKVAKVGKKYFLTFDKKVGNLTKTIVASSSNLSAWNIQGTLEGLKKTGAIAPDFAYDSDRVMYIGGKSIKIAYSEDLLDWREEKKILLKPKVGKFDAENLEPAAVFTRKEGLVLLYYAIDKTKKVSIGIALFSKDNPEELLWRGPKPVWKQKEKETVQPLGIVELNHKLFFYYEGTDGNLVSVALPIVWYKNSSLTGGEAERPMLTKHHKNPIIGPKYENRWENFGAFNPTAFEHDGKIYILYRAIGDDGASVVGLAISKDGVHIEERLNEPIFVPAEATACKENKTKIQSPSGGGYGGCEDPKVVMIDNRVYITYVAFNGNPETNIAISSISIEDFLNRKWKKWTIPVPVTTLDIDYKNPKVVREYLIDKPWLPKSAGIGHKNASILPEKVHGKYIFFNRVWPNIVIDELDSLDFDGKKFLKGDHLIPARKDMWDSHKISIGGSPVRIKEGWLAFYNAVDKKDSGKYKIGAMILDYEHPEKVLYRTSYPLIEPEMYYENNGFKYGIIFAGGSIIKDEQIFLYYGGSDTYSCVATAPLEEFVSRLIAGESPRLEKVKLLVK